MSFLKPSSLTPPQRHALVRLVREHRAITAGFGDGVVDKDFGSPGMISKLLRKGAIMVLREERGPRGGKRRVLAPTPEGYRVADYIVVNRLKTY